MTKPTKYHGRSVVWKDPTEGSCFLLWGSMSPTKRAHAAFKWIKQIAADYRELPALTVMVAMKLLDLFDTERDDGAAWLGQDKLAAKSNVDIRTVRRILAALARRGHLAVDGGIGGRGLSNVYRLIQKNPDSSVLDNDDENPDSSVLDKRPKTRTARAENPDSSCTKTRTAHAPKPGQSCPPTSSYLKTLDLTPPHQERARARGGDDDGRR